MMHGKITANVLTLLNVLEVCFILLITDMVAIMVKLTP